MEDYEALEVAFGKVIGNPNTVAVSSGTAALHLALETFDRRGATVFVPEFTMVACPRAVVMADMKPEFIDCRDDLLMDTRMLSEEAKHTPPGSVIMPVHIYGRYCNMVDVSWIAATRKMLIVEDMSEIHGVNPYPSTDAACWSFYKNKIIHGEEGGMIAFKKPEHAVRAKQLRSHGFTEAHDFSHIPRGVNARMSNTHAALILKSLRDLEYHLEKRQYLAEEYRRNLPPSWDMGTRRVDWVHDIRIPNLEFSQQNAIIQLLRKMGVEARHGFKPMSAQAEFNDDRRIGSYTHLNAYRLASEVIYLPISDTMTEMEAKENSKRLIEAVLEIAPPLAT